MYRLEDSVLVERDADAVFELGDEVEVVRVAGEGLAVGAEGVLLGSVSDALCQDTLRVRKRRVCPLLGEGHVDGKAAQRSRIDSETAAGREVCARRWHSDCGSRSRRRCDEGGGEREQRDDSAPSVLRAVS